MVTGLKQKTVKSIKVEYSDDPVTPFGGLALVERLSLRLGLWDSLEKALPSRGGHYDWLTVVKSAVAGLLTGSRGTYAAESIREESSTQKLLGIAGAPEEVTLWRSLEGLGDPDMLRVLGDVQFGWNRKILSRVSRKGLLVEGFFPVFGDGSLLEGSRRREGTKTIKDKGSGLMWTTVFAGPLLAGQRLCAKGEGEQSALRSLLPDIVSKVLKPLRFSRKALWQLDSLHGDGPTLNLLEDESQHYVAGANKLSQTQQVLSEMSEAAWQDLGPRTDLGWESSAVCVASIECEGWRHKRTLVGRRWIREGEFIAHYAGVLTDLSVSDVRHMIRRGISYAQAIWRLYDHKSGCENYYKDLLDDLGLHHPPCQEHQRNAGFYTLGALAHTLGRAVDLIGGHSKERGNQKRQDGGKRKRPKPKTMRLWRLRRRLFSLPGRIRYHARQVKMTLLGLSQAMREEYDRYWNNICRC